MPDEPKIELQLSTSSQQVTTVFHPRVFDMHTVADQELDELASGSQSVNLGLFGVAFGALVSVAITLSTVSLPTRMLAAYAGSCIALVLLSIYFGMQAIRDIVASRRRLNRIRKGGASQF